MILEKGDMVLVTVDGPYWSSGIVVTILDMLREERDESAKLLAYVVEFSTGDVTLLAPRYLDQEILYNGPRQKYLPKPFKVGDRAMVLYSSEKGALFSANQVWYMPEPGYATLESGDIVTIVDLIDAAPKVSLCVLATLSDGRVANFYTSHLVRVGNPVIPHEMKTLARSRYERL